jgi:hypothetical protein
LSRKIKKEKRKKHNLEGQIEGNKNRRRKIKGKRNHSK